MTALPDLPGIRVPVKLVVLFLCSALIVREFLRWHLQQIGIDSSSAKHLSAIPAFLLLAAFLWPVVQPVRAEFRRLFARPDSWRRLLLVSFCIGLLLRFVDWTMRIAYAHLRFDWIPQALSEDGRVIWWECQPAAKLTLGFAVMALVTPILEETTHRGLTYVPLRRYGNLLAAFFSSLVFAVCHDPYGMPFAFVYGLVASYQLQVCKTLWAPIVSHATVNGMITLDFDCIRGLWHPGWVHPDITPMLIFSGLFSLALVSWLVPKAVAQDA